MSHTNAKLRVRFADESQFGPVYWIETDAEDSEPVAYVDTVPGGDPIDKANAERLVHCWNNFDAMLAALKNAVFRLKLSGIGTWSLNQTIADAEKEAQK